MSLMLHSQGVSVARIVIAILTVCSFFTTDGFAENPSQVHPVEAAKAAIKAKNDELAIPLLSNFVRTNATTPEAVEARFLLGQVQSRQGHTQQALDNFRLVISSGRDTEWAAKALDLTANIHETRRNPTSAQQTRNILLRDYPESSAASPHLWQAASSCFQLSDYRNALRLFDIYLATPYAKHRQEAESMREIAKLVVHGDATAANTRRAELHRNRGEALLSRRLYAQARTNFNDALTHITGSTLHALLASSTNAIPLINSLIAANNNYDDDIPYSAFPDSQSDGRNSNSYIAGILLAVGVDPPSITDADVPGYDVPVDALHFQ